MFIREEDDLPTPRGPTSERNQPFPEPALAKPSRRLRLFSIFLIAFALLQFGFGGAAECYDLAGHFDSVAAVIYGLDPSVSADDANLVAFCAWLPDQTTELNAVDVYWAMLGSPSAYACWSGSYGPLKTFCGSAPVANMVAVQQLLHALTGADSTAMQAVAGETVRQLWEESANDKDLNVKCALGFALHLFGDSFAHTEMTWRQSSNPEQGSMYPTGVGHGPEFHKPDRPLYRADRVRLWEFYTARLASRFAPAQEVDAIQTCIKKAPDAYAKEGSYFYDMWVSLDYGETFLEDYLVKCISDSKHTLQPFPATTAEPCETLIRRHLGPKDRLTCADTWNRFSRTSASAFRACDQHTLAGCEKASARDQRYSKYDTADPLGSSDQTVSAVNPPAP